MLKRLSCAIIALFWAFPAPYYIGIFISTHFHLVHMPDNIFDVYGIGAMFIVFTILVLLIFFLLARYVLYGKERVFES